MKSIKKIFSIFFLLVFAVSLVACGNDDKKDDNKKDDDKKNDVVDEVTVDVDLDSKWAGKLVGRTVYLTTCGQADSGVVSSILSNGGVLDEAYVSNDLLTAKEVEDAVTETSGVPVVILVVGASSKGLGAAGVDVSSETSRANEFASAASQNKIELIVVHVGGTARRGQTSDPIIKAAAPDAHLLLVVETGNADNYFTNTAAENSIELYLYSKNSKMIIPFKTLFGITE